MTIPKCNTHSRTHSHTYKHTHPHKHTHTYIEEERFPLIYLFTDMNGNMRDQGVREMITLVEIKVKLD